MDQRTASIPRAWAPSRTLFSAVPILILVLQASRLPTVAWTGPPLRQRLQGAGTHLTPCSSLLPSAGSLPSACPSPVLLPSGACGVCLAHPCMGEGWSVTVPLPPPEASLLVHHPLVTNIRSTPLPLRLQFSFVFQGCPVSTTPSSQSRWFLERRGRPQGASHLPLLRACKAANDESISEMLLASCACGIGPWPPQCTGPWPVHGTAARGSAL